MCLDFRALNKALCFWLTNAPATFQKVMNTVLKKHIDAGYRIAWCYLDDILIFSKDPVTRKATWC